MKRQQEATRSELPHRHHLLIEHYHDPLNTSDDRQVILHTLWGGKVNRPFCLSLQAAWEEKYGSPLETTQNNDGILLMAGTRIFRPSGPGPGNVGEPGAAAPGTLEQSGFFGAKFRENAGRALLLPRGDFKKRLPLWLNRLRSKNLLAAVPSLP